MKKIINIVFKEIVPIVIGILIALFINNWNENRKDKNYIDRISASLQKELNETHKDIVEKLVLQRTVLDTLNYYKTNDTTSILDIMMKVNGFSVPSIKLSSWNAISNSKIELMEYDKISSLTLIEDEKELLKIKATSLMSFVYSNMNETEIETKKLFELMILDVISTEIGIQGEIEKIIDK